MAVLAKCSDLSPPDRSHLTDRNRIMISRVLLSRYATILFIVLIAPIASAQPNAASDPSWAAEEVPSAWKRLDGRRYGSREGTLWFRCGVSVPEDWDGEQLTLFVEGVDDAREVFFNGQSIGCYFQTPYGTL